MGDAEELRRQIRQLRVLRFMRTWAHVPFILIFAVGGGVHALDWLWNGLFDPVLTNPLFRAIWLLLWVLAVSGFFVGYAVSRTKCPRCRNAFHARTRGALWFRNEFARSCLNCGLRLDGSNLEESNVGGNTS